jgi:hypothetical protein
MQKNSINAEHFRKFRKILEIRKMLNNQKISEKYRKIQKLKKNSESIAALF